MVISNACTVTLFNKKNPFNQIILKNTLKIRINKFIFILKYSTTEN